MIPVALVLLALIACEYTPPDSSAPVLDTAPPDLIMANLVLYNATTATGALGLSVEFPGGTATTASDGVANGEILADTPFELRVQGDGYLDHLVFGPAGGEDFSFVTYVAGQAITSQVLSMLGISWDAGTGIVVVGVDYENLSAVEGATVSLGASHGEPFVFAGGYSALSATNQAPWAHRGWGSGRRSET